MSESSEQRTFRSDLDNLRDLARFVLGVGAFWLLCGVVGGFVLSVTTSPDPATRQLYILGGIALMLFAIASGLLMILVARIAIVLSHSAKWAGSPDQVGVDVAQQT